MRAFQLTRRRPAWLVGILAVSLVLPLTACTQPSQPADRTERAQIVAALNASIASRDAEAQRNLLQYLPAATVERLVANFTQLAAVEFQLDGDNLQVTWNTAHSRPAHHQLRATMDCRGKVCALTQLSAVPDQPAPIWLLEEITVHEDAAVSVICGQHCDAAKLSAFASSALDDVNRGLPAQFRSGWDGRLVVLVPDSASSFAQTLGSSGENLTDVAAVSVSFDNMTSSLDAKQTMTAVLTNPGHFTALPQTTQRFVLSHEAVHVAAAALGVPAAGRRWVSEGIADHVALAAHPQFAHHATQLLRAACPLPTQPPTDGALLTASYQELELAYARSWALIEQMPQSDWLALWWADADWADRQPNLDVSQLCG